MAVIRLEEIEKEKYIKKLIEATNFLIKSIKEDELIKKTQWDIDVYNEVTRILENYILPIFELLQYTREEESYKDNFGIYKELILSIGGLPEFFSYRQLLEDKKLANEKLKQILKSENINSKEELIKKWIDIANNDSFSSKEEKREYLLDILPQKFQTIQFYEKIQDKQIFDTTDLSIKILNEKLEKEYLVSFFNYSTGFGVWNIYIMKLFEIGLKKNIFQKDNAINIDSEFKKYIQYHMDSGAFFLAREIGRIFPGLYPERTSGFQFGPVFIKGISTGSLDFSWLFVENPEAFFLTSIREDIQSCDDEETIYKNDTKCSWKFDKISEQRFGICSKELEKYLKEYIKFKDMRLYVF